VGGYFSFVWGILLLCRGFYSKIFYSLDHVVYGVEKLVFVARVFQGLGFFFLGDFFLFSGFIFWSLIESFSYFRGEGFSGFRIFFLGDFFMLTRTGTQSLSNLTKSQGGLIWRTLTLRSHTEWRNLPGNLPWTITLTDTWPYGTLPYGTVNFTTLCKTRLGSRASDENFNGYAEFLWGLPI